MKVAMKKMNEVVQLDRLPNIELKLIVLFNTTSDFTVGTVVYSTGNFQ